MQLQDNLLIYTLASTKLPSWVVIHTHFGTGSCLFLKKQTFSQPSEIFTLTRYVICMANLPTLQLQHYN